MILEKPTGSFKGARLATSRKPSSSPEGRRSGVKQGLMRSKSLARPSTFSWLSCSLITANRRIFIAPVKTTQLGRLARIAIQWPASQRLSLSPKEYGQWPSNRGACLFPNQSRLSGMPTSVCCNSRTGLAPTKPQMRFHSAKPPMVRVCCSPERVRGGCSRALVSMPNNYAKLCRGT